MFTGIIEALGRVRSITHEGTNVTFLVHSPISNELKVDQSVSHNGVCLTVEALTPDTHRVTAIHETIQKTNLGQVREGDLINLERCLRPDSRLDGHFVQGHVDSTGSITSISDEDGSWLFRISFQSQFAGLLIEKGSIALNGISLTIFDVTTDAFSVAIIPFTYAHTNLSQAKVGDSVNLEFDLVGKYIVRNLHLQSKSTVKSDL
jgi:riboflavin synthase